VRHTDARRLAQSGANKEDRPVTRELVELVRYFVGWDADSSVEPKLLILVAPHVDE
jgi:hypothetical protein